MFAKSNFVPTNLLLLGLLLVQSYVLFLVWSDRKYLLGSSVKHFEFDCLSAQRLHQSRLPNLHIHLYRFCGTAPIIHFHKELRLGLCIVSLVSADVDFLLYILEVSLQMDYPGRSLPGCSESATQWMEPAACLSSLRFDQRCFQPLRLMPIGSGVHQIVQSRFAVHSELPMERHIGTRLCDCTSVARSIACCGDLGYTSLANIFKAMIPVLSTANTIEPVFLASERVTSLCDRKEEVYQCCNLRNLSRSASAWKWHCSEHERTKDSEKCSRWTTYPKGESFYFEMHSESGLGGLRVISRTSWHPCAVLVSSQWCHRCFLSTIRTDILICWFKGRCIYA